MVLNLCQGELPSSGDLHRIGDTISCAWTREATFRGEATDSPRTQNLRQVTCSSSSSTVPPLGMWYTLVSVHVGVAVGFHGETRA